LGGIAATELAGDLDETLARGAFEEARTRRVSRSSTVTARGAAMRAAPIGEVEPVAPEGEALCARATGALEEMLPAGAGDAALPTVAPGPGLPEAEGA